MRSIERRRFLKDAATVAGTAFVAGNSFFTGVAAYAQDPPVCPAPPTGGQAFVPGNDTRPITVRKSIGSLTAAELTKLSNAFAALRALPASDKRTWVIQADIHALFCSSCNNSVSDIHGWWTFLPWHRAYLYYFERILGSLVGDINNFRLPYWDWENIRTLPSPYVSPSGAGNSLWDNSRDPGLAGGGNLPAGDGTHARIATLYGLTDFATFGGDAGSAGSLEPDPHGVIHSDVGVPPYPWHDMGDLGYAARDPLFFAHHCNIDKLWSGWNDLASGGSGTDYKNPTDTAFLNVKWSFWDENQHTVSISAADVLDHDNQLRYTYKIQKIRVPPLEVILACRFLCCRPGPDPGPYLEVTEQVRELVLRSFRVSSPIVLVLRGVRVPEHASGSFDVLAVRDERRTVIGSIGLISHGRVEHRRMRPLTLTFNVTAAAEDLFAKEKPAILRVIRRAREKSRELAKAGKPEAQAFTLKAESAEIRLEKR